MAIASPPSVVGTTTGLRVIASVDRIATCGWLITGIVSTDPAEPLLEIVNVPPLISSGINFFVRARLARSLMCSAIALRRRSSASRMTGTMSPS